MRTLRPVALIASVLLLSCSNEPALEGTTGVPSTEATASSGRLSLLAKVAQADTVAREIESRRESLRVVERPSPSHTTEGGRLIGYYDEAGIRLLRLHSYGEMGNVEESYYFDVDGAVAVAWRVEGQYDRPFYEDGWTVRDRRQTTEYFSAGALLATQTPEGMMLEPSSEARDKREEAVQADIGELLSTLSAPTGSASPGPGPAN